MENEKYDLGNGFSLFYDWNKVIPFFDSIPTKLAEEIKLLIWNKAFENSVDYTSCGDKGQFRFFIIKDQNFKVSYKSYDKAWIIYSIVRINPNEC